MIFKWFKRKKPLFQIYFAGYNIQKQPVFEIKYKWNHMTAYHDFGVGMRYLVEQFRDHFYSYDHRLK